jgi:hypothetical protein
MSQGTYGTIRPADDTPADVEIFYHLPSRVVLVIHICKINRGLIKMDPNKEVQSNSNRY